MATEVRSAGGGSNDAAVGTRTWSGFTNLALADDVRATSQGLNTTLGTTSQYLKASTFGFAIPAGATPDGISVRVERSQATAQNTKDFSVKIAQGGVVGGTEHADAVTVWPVGVAEAYTTYGSATDLWGLAWTVADINAANFGVAIAAINDTATSVVERVDHVEITVFYTAASGAAPKTLSALGVG